MVKLVKIGTDCIKIKLINIGPPFFKFIKENKWSQKAIRISDGK